MFTGLVEATGALAARRTSGPGAVLEVQCGLGPLPLEIGESISVEGACLTVKRLTPRGFEADVSVETLDRTTLGMLAVGASVNLERSMKLGARLGGHLVTGHVDATCTLTARRPLGDATGMTFSFPAPLGRLVAEKGSVAINGVSLTVNAVRDLAGSSGGLGVCELDFVIVPHTQDVTSLGALAVGGRANLEVDLIARYVARMLGAAPARTGTEPHAASRDAEWLERLARAGYL